MRPGFYLHRLTRHLCGAAVVVLCAAKAIHDRVEYVRGLAGDGYEGRR